MTKTFSLYIHIPFCAHKCPYCDFNTYAVPTPPEAKYIAALKKELRQARESGQWQDKKLTTIFFGGGTPSFLSAKGLVNIVAEAKKIFVTNDLQEVSIEANPEHITDAYAAELLAGGVTRVSLGVQSLTDKNLVKLGRNHNSTSAKEAVGALSKAGFKNISLDLMYGTPGQSLEDLLSDINTAGMLPINHISIYGLTIETGTPFFVSHAKGDLKIPNEDDSAQMYEKMLETLSTLGFLRYEVSNFAKSQSAQSLHNINYWQHGEYLGIGAGAHSFVRTPGAPYGLRWSNEAKPESYMQKLSDDKNVVAWTETLTARQALGETFFVGLRMVEGVPFERAKKFSGGLDPGDVLNATFRQCVAEELLLTSSLNAQATDKGLQFLDSMLIRFF